MRPWVHGAHYLTCRGIPKKYVMSCLAARDAAISLLDSNI